MANLLALDQASLTSGFAVFKDGNLFDYGKFTFSDEDIADRLVKIRKKVIDLIEQYEITGIILLLHHNQINMLHMVHLHK